MLFVDRQQERLLQSIIALGARESTGNELAVVLDAGKAAKPYMFDLTVAGLAQRYRGDQVTIIEAKLKERFPHAGKMPVTPVNWLATFARADAGIYIADAERYLENEQGEPLPRDDPREVAFQKALEDIGMLGLMPELERRALTGVKTAIVCIGWRKLGEDDEGRPVAHMYWPNDAIVLCHPSAPDDERAMVVCALKTTPTSAKEGIERYWVWSREAVEVDGVLKGFKEWKHCTINSDGTHATLPVTYPGKMLPVPFVRLEQADGGFWPIPERDTIAQVDELNIGRSNEQHTSDLQGHSQGVVFTTKKIEQLPTGPDRWPVLDPQDRIEAINFNPKLPDMRAGRVQQLREVAISHSANPDTFATTPTAAISGVSRALANLPHDQRTRELRPIWRLAEEQRILRVLLEVIEIYSPKDISFAGLQPRVRFGRVPDLEELDQKQRRLEIDLKLGIISKAQYAVLMGHYDNVPAAVKAGLSDRLEAQATPTPSTGEPQRRPGAPAPPPPPAPAADDDDAEGGDDEEG